MTHPVGRYPTGETVTVLPRVQTGTDAYNNPVFGWPGPGIEITNCPVAPRTNAEPLQDGRDPVIVGVTVYLPTDAQIGPRDRMTVRGDLYEVDGEPGDWRSPYTGWLPGIAVQLRRVEG